MQRGRIYLPPFSPSLKDERISRICSRFVKISSQQDGCLHHFAPPSSWLSRAAPINYNQVLQTKASLSTNESRCLFFFFFFLNKDHSKIIQKFIYKDKTRFGKAFNELPSPHILPSLNPLLHFVFNSGLQRCVPAGGAKYIQGCIRRYY